MFLPLEVLTVSEVGEVGLAVIVSAVPILPRGEMYRQVDLLQKFLQEGLRLRVDPPQALRHQFLLVQR